MKKVIFFDLDGTLTDPSIGITNSVMYSLKTYGIEETDREKLYPFIGPPLVDSFGKYYGFPEEKGREATRRFQEYFSQKGAASFSAEQKHTIKMMEKRTAFSVGNDRESGF